MSKYGYTEKRTITRDRMRALCIEREWFTLSTNSEYTAFLDKAESIGNITTDDLVELATEVKEYSDTDMMIENIMWFIANSCFVFFEESA